MPSHRRVLQTALVTRSNHAKEVRPASTKPPGAERMPLRSTTTIPKTQLGVTGGRGNGNPTNSSSERLVHKAGMENNSVGLTKVDWHVPAGTAVSTTVHVKLTLERHRGSYNENKGVGMGQIKDMHAAHRQGAQWKLVDHCLLTLSGYLSELPKSCLLLRPHGLFGPAQGPHGNDMGTLPTGIDMVYWYRVRSK